MISQENTMSQGVSQTAESADRRPIWKQYLALCKLKVVALISFTALVGMIMAINPKMPFDSIPWMRMVLGMLGIFLASSAAAAINHVVDNRIDAIMQRTKARPVATGELSARNALIFATLLTVISMIILVVWVNRLTAILTFISLIGYAVIYTMYLKRATSQNIVIGGAAGAAPPVLGWAAVWGGTDPFFYDSFWLFLLIFIWTPPHFWALAIYRRAEYSRVNIPMLPVTHGTGMTRLYILLYTILLLVISVMPYLVKMSGPVYLAGALVLGFGFLYYAIRLYVTRDDVIAMRTFVYSIYYLIGMFAFLLIDHFLHQRVTISYPTFKLVSSL
jgi:protoheme IX farnesyltransferase